MGRRLIAILAADVVGYSRLMGADEAGTLNAVKALRREVFAPKVAEHHGRIVKLMGDGALVEFPSVVHAVECAVAVQQTLAERNAGTPADKRVVLRIGVNLGDVIVESDDIYGDGVNVAARLEALSEPGGIALSGSAHDHVTGKVDFAFEDAGEHELKNIARPVHVWRWPEASNGKSTVTAERLPLPEKPSIAVLPFENMSDDPEQGYFVDGMVEDILTTLSKVPDLFVIARNSSFTYKEKTVDVRDVGRELGVKYVVEGSVRKAGKRVRVTAQLIECATGGHVWADRFDGELDDVFELQDRITQTIVTALEVKLTEGEQVRVWRERSGSALVYETYYRARRLYLNFSRQTHRQARMELERALKINPTYIPALIHLGYSLVDQARFGWVDDRDAAFNSALEVANRALAVDPYYGEVYSIISYARSFQRRHEEAVEAAEKAVSLSPNNAIAFHMSAMSQIYAGNFATGRDYEEQYSRLSPMDLEVSLIDLARAEYHLGAFEEAWRAGAQVLESQPRWLTAQTIVLAALWRLGREDKAREVGANIIRGHSQFSVARWSKGFPYRRAEDLQALMEPLIQAGLAE